MHVLHRETHDGQCDSAQQGPLETCEDMPYERFAEIRVAGEPGVTETIELVEASGARRPLDCKQGRYGDQLIDP